MLASRLVVPVVALALAFGLAACGSDSGSGTTSNASASQRPNGGRGFLSDPKVQACLKKQGVTIPTGRRPNGGNGQPPYGGGGQPPSSGSGQAPGGGSGQAPGGANGNGRNSAQFQKLRQALQKCGVNFPRGGQNGPPQQQNQSTTGTSAT